MRIFLLVLATIGLVSVPFAARAAVTGEVGKADKGLKVPREMIKEIEDWFLTEHKRANKVLNESDKEVMRQLQRHGLELEVELKPLRGDSIEDDLNFSIPMGGGVIDLARALPKSKGSISWSFKVKDEQPGGLIRVFYLSNARTRTLFDQNHGVGCLKWLELTSWFAHNHQQKPLEAILTDQSYVSVLAGAWVFALLHENHLSLSTVVVTDSRFPQLLCRKPAAE